MKNYISDKIIYSFVYNSVSIYIERNAYKNTDRQKGRHTHKHNYTHTDGNQGYVAKARTLQNIGIYEKNLGHEDLEMSL